MTKHNHLVRSATPAIAAVLALSSTPLLAQDILVPPPVVAAPVPSAAPPAAAGTVIAPPPVIGAPATTRQPTNVESRPVVQQVPPAAPVEPSQTAAAPTPRANPATSQAVPLRNAPVQTERAVAPAARTPVQQPVPAAPVEQPAPAALEDTAPVTPRAAVAPVTPVEPAATTQGDGLPVELQLLAALAGLGVLIGAIALLRRRRRASVPAAAAVERPVVAKTPAEPQPAARIEQPVPVQQASVQPIREPVPAGSLPHSGAAIALPREMPATIEERDALIARMVAARPDRANPFTSPKARHRRARLILQSLGRNFEGRDPQIDLSQYPNNWPELARRDYPRVA